MNTPLTLSTSNGSSAAPTMLSVGVTSASAVPEPASLAVFALAMGSLGFWKLRRAG
jgi:hypothetical protein